MSVSSPPDPDSSAGATTAAVGRGARIIEIAMVAGLLAVLSLGVSILGLAMYGRARPVVSFLVAGVVWVVLLALWRPDRHLRDSTERPAPTAALIAGLLVIAISGVTNLVHNGQNVRITRDMDVYVVSGFTIAHTGDVLEDARYGGLENAPGLSITGSGQAAHGPDQTKVESQGAHLVPSLYAAGHWIGGYRGVQAMPAVIGAAALTALFLLALRVTRPWVAVAVVAAMAANFVFVYAVRSSLSEPMSLLVVSFAVWALIEAVRSGAIGRLLVAGFIAGTIMTTRIDGGVAVVALPIAGAIGLLSNAAAGRDPAERRRFGLRIVAYVIGLIAAAAIAFTDLRRTNRAYLERLGDLVDRVELLLLLGFAAAMLIVLMTPIMTTDRWKRTSAWLSARRSRLAAGGAAATGIVLASLWWVRPLFGPEHASRLAGGGSVMAGIQEREGFEPDATRTYAEVLMERIGWYLGPIGLLLAVVGLMVIVHRVLRRTGDDPGLILLAALLPTMALYFWQPHIYPDQPWMMRRFLPVVFPIFLLAAGIATAAVEDLARRLAPDGRRWLTSGPVLTAAAILVVGPLQVTWPARDMRWQAGGYAGLQSLCDAVGPDATLVITNRNAFGTLLVPSVRAMCRIPAARPRPELDASGAELPITEIRDAVEEAGNRLWVLGPSAERLAEEFPTAGPPTQITVLDTTQLASTLAYPPGRMVPRRLVVFVAPVDR